MLPAFLYESRIKPINIGNKTLPIAPAIPPNPTTELIAFFGNISGTIAKILALQAWFAATERLIKATTAHISVVYLVAIMGITQKAETSSAAFLALFTVHPFLINHEERYPPPMLPTIVPAYTITSGKLGVFKSRLK